MKILQEAEDIVEWMEKTLPRDKRITIYAVCLAIAKELGEYIKADLEDPESGGQRIIRESSNPQWFLMPVSILNLWNQIKDDHGGNAMLKMAMQAIKDQKDKDPN